MSIWNLLPDLLERVFSYFDVPQLGTLSCVNRAWLASLKRENGAVWRLVNEKYRHGNRQISQASRNFS